MKKTYGFEILDSETMRALERAKVPKTPIQGTPWYSVLSNPDFCDKFVFYGPHIEKREKLIKDGSYSDESRFEQSDAVMILLYLSFIPDSVV